MGSDGCFLISHQNDHKVSEAEGGGMMHDWCGRRGSSSNTTYFPHFKVPTRKEAQNVYPSNENESGSVQYYGIMYDYRR